MDETIDKIFENTQETYEDFVGSLLFLSEENCKILMFCSFWVVNFYEFCFAVL